MKIRIYSPHFPAPVTEGSFLVIYDQWQALQRLGHEVELVTWRSGPSSAAPTPGPVVHWNLPKTWRDRAAIRVLSAAASGRASPELLYYPPRGDRRGTLPVADLGIYHYSFAHSWLRFPSIRSERTRCVHFHNRESRLFYDRANLASDAVTRAIHRRNAAVLKSHERSLASLVEECWFLSAEDLSSYRARGPAKLRLVPPTLAPDTFPPSRRGSGPRPSIGFIGVLDFGPNEASVSWLLDHVAPRLEASGFTGKLRIAGRGAAPSLKERAARFAFIEWLGFVQDAGQFWDGIDALAVPHVRGSGVRTKVLEAIARGVPVLVNEEALAPMMEEIRSHPLVKRCEKPEDWARAMMSESLCSLRLSPPPPPAELQAESVYSFLTPTPGSGGPESR